MTSTANKNILFGFFAVLFLFFLTRAISTEQYYLATIPFVILLLYAGWQYINLVFLVLLFTLPFSTEYQFTESLGTDFPDELLMLFVTGLFLCYWVYKPTVLPRTVRQHPLIVLLLITIIWAIVSSVFSTQPLLSVKFLLAKGWYIGAFILAPLIVFQEKKMLQRAIAALVIAMMIVVLIVLVRHAVYGFTFASINEALRPFFRNHVNYSAMLVCIIPVVVVFARSAKGRMKTIAITAAAILVGALFLSYARGAWLALLTGMLAAWLIRKKLLVAAYITVLLILFVSLFWLKTNDRYLRYAHDFKTTIWHEDFNEHLAATYKFKDASTAERFYRWIAGVRMIKDNWLTGYGPNSFYDNYKPYAVPAFKTWVSDNKEHSTVHNYFLLIAIEQGIPGLLFFLLLTTALLYYAQRIYHRSADIFYKRIALVTGIITMMLLTVNFLSDLIETDKIGSLFFLCLSVLIIADIKSSPSHSTHPAVHSPAG